VFVQAGEHRAVAARDAGQAITEPHGQLLGELRAALDATIRQRVMADSAADLVVRMSPLGDDVVLVGAAVLVLSGELGIS